MFTKQQGFTLFELIIIVVIIVLLIATVIPRLMDSHDGVYEFSIERIAEEFASEVGLVKARWEVEGRPSGNNGNSSATVVKHRENQLGVDGTLDLPNRAIPSHGTPDATMFDGFTYNPATGQISIF